MKEKAKSILVVVVKWRHRVNGLLSPLSRVWGPFLESPGNFSGPKEIKYSNRNIKNKSAGPGQETNPFCFTNWWFYHARCKTIETSIFNVNGDSLPGPLIIGTFRSCWNLHRLCVLKIPENARICQHCFIEGELHFIFDCSLFQAFR